jgi:hypothetical protein
VRLVLACLALLGILGLTACGSDDHPGQHCVHSHPETTYVNGVCLIWTSVGKGVRICSLYQQIPITTDVCDQWAPDTTTPAEEQHA